MRLSQPGRRRILSRQMRSEEPGVSLMSLTEKDRTWSRCQQGPLRDIFWYGIMRTRSKEQITVATLSCPPPFSPNRGSWNLIDHGEEHREGGKVLSPPKRCRKSNNWHVASMGSWQAGKVRGSSGGVQQLPARKWKWPRPTLLSANAALVALAHVCCRRLFYADTYRVDSFCSALVRSIILWYQILAPFIGKNKGPSGSAAN